MRCPTMQSQEAENSSTVGRLQAQCNGTFIERRCMGVRVAHNTSWPGSAEKGSRKTRSTREDLGEMASSGRQDSEEGAKRGESKSKGRIGRQEKTRKGDDGEGRVNEEARANAKEKKRREVSKMGKSEQGEHTSRHRQAQEGILHTRSFKIPGYRRLDSTRRSPQAMYEEVSQEAETGAQQQVGNRRRSGVDDLAMESEKDGGGEIWRRGAGVGRWSEPSSDGDGKVRVSMPE